MVNFIFHLYSTNNYIPNNGKMLSKITELRKKVLNYQQTGTYVSFDKTNFSNFTFRLYDINNCFPKNGNLWY